MTDITPMDEAPLLDLEAQLVEIGRALRVALGCLNTVLGRVQDALDDPHDPPLTGI